MRRFLLFALFLLPCPTWATFSAPTQAVFNNSCAASSSCAVTVSAIGAGHLLVVLAHIGNTQQLSSVTAAGETFTVIPSAGGAGDNCPFNSGGNVTQVGCAYALKSVGGATTVTCNWSGTASASNTSCGFYEVAFTAPRVFLESNSGNGQHGSASTFLGVDFANNFTNFINGTNDIIFQSTNVSTGTISSINTSFVLDNNAGQVADAHRLNTFDNTAPTWVNSGAATSIISAVSFGEDYNPNTASLIPATTPNSGLQLSYSGAVGTRLVTVIAPGQFQFSFDEGDAWGIAYWYDLVNDPSVTTNLLGPACPVGSCDANAQKTAEPGLFQRTYYNAGDVKQYTRSSQFYFPNSPRQLSILEYNPSRIVIETKSEPTVTVGSIANNLIGLTRYYIYPSGKIYVHHVVTVTNGVTISANGNGIFSDVTLEDPTQTGTTPPDSQGWIRASATQNPYSNVGSAETYLFSYWGPSTPAPYANYTKASILLVRSPTNLYDNGQIVHSWGSGVGFGVVRWGWNSDGAGNVVLGNGGTETEDMLIQLGTQGSTVLPNITSSTVAGPIAAAYIANPTPPLPTTQAILSLSPAVVNQGATMTFTATDTGTWSCAGTDSSGSAAACAGSINSSSGLYTAPASVTAQRSYGGFQLLPNNHVFNTRIDSLGVHASSVSWMQQLLDGSPSGTPGYLPAFPLNYVTAATPTVNMHFYYSAVNDGIFTVPTFPNVRIESGWFHALSNQSGDHHLTQINTSTGAFSEFYQYYARCTTTAASVSGNVATLTCSTNPLDAGFLSGRTVQVGGFTGGDTYFNGTVTLTAVTAATITYALTHANASATSSGSATYNSQGGGCSTTGTCNSQSGLSYSYFDYALPAITTDAAGLELMPLSLGIQEFEQAVATGGTINHALRMTEGQGFEASSSVWPATTFATDGGFLPFGIRARLKSTFPIGGFSAAAQVLLKQLQQYGLVNADGGTMWQINGEMGRVPKTYYDAMSEVAIATKTFTITNTSLTGNVATITAVNDLVTHARVTITGTANGGGAYNVSQASVVSASGTQFTFALIHADIGSAADSGTVAANLASYMEFVDESGLQVAANETCPTPSTCGLTTHNRETITFTRTSDSTTASVDVALQGPALNLPQDHLYIQAGSPAQQLAALTNMGSATWTWSPAITGGTLSAGGLLTPPATIASVTSTTVTATSTLSASVAAQMTVYIFPTGTIYVLPGQSTNYTDTTSHLWNGRLGTNLPDTMGCCNVDGSFPNITDKTLWSGQVGASSVAGPDPRMDFIVPNGTYTITYNVGSQWNAGTFQNKLSTQGLVSFTGDFATLAGGIHLPLTITQPNISVTDNHLSFVIWNYKALGGNNNPVSSLSIASGSSPAGSTITPGDKVTSGVSIK